VTVSLLIKNINLKFSLSLLTRKTIEQRIREKFCGATKTTKNNAWCKKLLVSIKNEPF
jgi:hypothetical protein